MNLSDRIKEERERLGHSQTAFAALAGASKHSQINWEKGVGTPTAAVLATWAAHGLDVLYVVTGVRTSGQPAPANPRQAALLDNFEHLSEDDKKALERTAFALAQSNAVVVGKKTVKRSA